MQKPKLQNKMLSGMSVDTSGYDSPGLFPPLPRSTHAKSITVKAPANKEFMAMRDGGITRSREARCMRVKSIEISPIVIRCLRDIPYGYRVS